ncbi:MAG: hypothetical protein AAF604_24125 [Acidobacteriota bacterium]
MRRYVAPLRVLVGGIFLAFGLNGFFSFAPMPELGGDAGALQEILRRQGFTTVVLVLQIAAGALLLIDRFVPLALIVVAPVLLSLVLFHLFLEPVMLPLILVLAALVIFLFWSYRPSFVDLLASRAEPHS